MAWLISLLLYVWGGWGLYVMLMAIYRLHLAKMLSRDSYVLAAPFVVIGLVLDFVGNVTLCWLLFLDPPREWLVSKRLRRYIYGKKDWRHDIACWICTNALNPFDARGGEHC